MNEVDETYEKYMADVGGDDLAKKRIADEERRKYLEGNNLTEEELTEQDLANINFNVEYALTRGTEGPGHDE